MVLYIPNQSDSVWSYDNWGANPSSTIGTAVTSGTANAEGSWTQVASSSNIAEDVSGIYLQVHTGSATGNLRPALIDIGVDPAGGTSYVSVISDILCGFTPSLTVAGNREFFFPFKINKGSSVAVRIQGRYATSHRVAVRFYGRVSRPEMFPVGQYSDTFGVTNNGGTPFTPGNAANGSWTSLGTTTRPIWWWQLGYQIWNTTITAEYTYIELGYGDGTETGTQSFFKMMHGGTTGETVGLAAQTHLLWLAAYYAVPAGANIYVRGRCNNAPDSGYQAVAIGIGG